MDNAALKQFVNDHVSAGSRHRLEAIVASDDQERSFGWWLDECLRKGVGAIEHQREAAAGLRKARTNDANLTRFNRELSQNPSIATNPAKLMELMRKYKLAPSASDSPKLVQDEPAKATA